MKKLVLPPIIFLLSIFYVFSQSTYSFYIYLSPGQNKIVVLDEMTNIDGSPYLKENWQQGSIVMKSGDTIPTIMLRYNFYKGEMQFQQEETPYVIGEPEKIKEIHMGGRVFIYLSYTVEGKVKKNFFEVLSEGESSLLSYYYPEILPPNYNVALNSGNQNKQIILRNKYFLKTGDNFIPIDKKGKNIFSAFEQKGKEIQKYSKDNNLSFNKEPDLILITKYINSLNK